MQSLFAAADNKKNKKGVENSFKGPQEAKREVQSNMTA